MNDQMLTQFYLDLTRLQRKILQLTADGLTNAEIAAKLSIQPCVVAEYLTVLYELLGNCEAYSSTRPNRYLMIRVFSGFFDRNPSLRTVKHP